MGHQLKASTIMETIVAMLILMISFSAGMVIYNRMMLVGVNEQFMRVDMETGFLADSIAGSEKPEAQVISRSEQVYDVKFHASESHPGLSVMTVEGKDVNQKIISRQTRLINMP